MNQALSPDVATLFGCPLMDACGSMEMMPTNSWLYSYWTIERVLNSCHCYVQGLHCHCCHCWHITCTAICSILKQSNQGSLSIDSTNSSTSIDRGVDPLQLLRTYISKIFRTDYKHSSKLKISREYCVCPTPSPSTSTTTSTMPTARAACESC
jgi:hypothetical protein